MGVLWLTGPTVITETTGQMLPEQALGGLTIYSPTYPTLTPCRHMAQGHGARLQSTLCPLFQDPHTISWAQVSLSP